MKKIFVVFVVSFLFCSCGPEVTFDEPQPAGSKALAGFPGKLHGAYFAGDGESVVTIDDSTIVQVYDFDMKCNKDSLPASYKLKGDTLVISDFGDYTEKQKVSFLNDSIITYHEHLIDTLFSLSGFCVLKKLKGYYFLNEKVQTDSNKYAWEVRKLALHKGLLTISFIDNPDEMKKLREITETAADTGSYSFKPTRKQFKEFLDEDGFDKVDTFYRMKQD